MNDTLKKNLTFDRSTGKICVNYKTAEDLVILPTFENLRIIGKVNRYFIFYMLGNTKCKKIFGKNFFYVKDGFNSKLLVCDDEGDKAMLMIILFFEWIVKLLILLVILKVCLSIKK